LLVRGPLEKLCLDGQWLSPAERVSVDLAPGVHTLTLVVGTSSAAPLRVELADGSTAQAQFVGGK
jgi:hypothetical protein